MRTPSGHFFLSPMLARWRPPWTGIAAVVFPIVLVLALMLAACGQPTGIASGGARGQATATGVSEQTGCPGATQSVSWPAPPTVVLTTPFPSGPTTLRAGQTLEVALPFGHIWRFQAGSEQPALTLDQPAGYGDSGTRNCVWRFTAKQAGQVQLTFTMQALCPPHTSCPQYIMLLKASVTVTPVA